MTGGAKGDRRLADVIGNAADIMRLTRSHPAAPVSIRNSSGRPQDLPPTLRARSVAARLHPPAVHPLLGIPDEPGFQGALARLGCGLKIEAVRTCT